MTGIIVNSVYEYLEMYNLLPVEQKGCRKKSCGKKDQLLIDKMVLNDCKKVHTNLGMVWIYYQKAYDMIPHSWILQSLGLVQVSENVVKFIRKSMRNWNTNLTSCGEYLANVAIKKRHLSGKQFVTIAICDLYDIPDQDIKKTEIRVYLEKWRKV